jgi:bzd-type benzoyl-CoA reductase N subunit
MVKIRELCGNFPQAKAILDWKKEGKKVAGWVCTYVPEEVIMAAGMLPIRMTGINRELELEQANAYLYINTCSFARSCMELGLQKQYDYLDGLVAGATCDGSRRLFDVWKNYIPTPFLHILSVPRKFTEDAHQLYLEEVEEFKTRLEEFIQAEITDQGLKEAIEICNETRQLLHQLYELRKLDKPPLSGAEILEITNASYRMPKPQFNELLRQLLTEVEGREALPGDRPRLMINGSILNNHEFIQAIEKAGSIVVIDELCTGTRYFWRLVEEDNLPPLQAIARRYLDNTPCARMNPWDVRLEHVMNMVKEYRVQGAVTEIIRYCVPYAHDEPLLRHKLNEIGIPVLELDVEYGMGETGQIKTRVEAFLEMIQGR